MPYDENKETSTEVNIFTIKLIISIIFAFEEDELHFRNLNYTLCRLTTTIV